MNWGRNGLICAQRWRDRARHVHARCGGGQRSVDVKTSSDRPRVLTECTPLRCSLVPPPHCPETSASGPCPTTSGLDSGGAGALLHPMHEIGLYRLDRPIDLLPERDASEFMPHRLVEAFVHPVGLRMAGLRPGVIDILDGQRYFVLLSFRCPTILGAAIRQSHPHLARLHWVAGVTVRGVESLWLRHRCGRGYSPCCGRLQFERLPARDLLLSTVRSDDLSDGSPPQWSQYHLAA